MAKVGDSSKGISTPDDAVGQFIIETLNGDITRGFDIESIYCETKSDGSFRWVLFEFLKCITVPPENSHPKFYWKTDKERGIVGNKRKFLSLWSLIQTIRASGIDADLILVNYRDVVSKVITMKVQSMDEDNIATVEHHEYAFEEWQKVFRRFNKEKSGNTWDILEFIERRNK